MDLVEQAILSLPPHPHVLVLSDSQGYLAALAQVPLRQRTHCSARLWAADALVRVWCVFGGIFPRLPLFFLVY